MNFLFFFILLFSFTVIESHKQKENVKDGRRGIVPTASSSSEEYKGRGRKSGRPPKYNDHDHSRTKSSEEEDSTSKCPFDWISFERSQGIWCVKFNMIKFHLFLLLLVGVTVVFGIFVDDEKSNGGKKKHHRHDHSSSGSSEENGRGNGRPPGRPRPPPGSDNSGSQCPSDWITFDRSQGRWCVKIFVGLLTQLAAETQCRAMNATLTGLQNDAERLKLAEAGRNIMLQNNYGDAAIWLGARRKGSCPLNGMCFPKETFFWTDNFTTGIDGFGFSTGQPDAVYFNAWGHQSCVHQFIFSSGTTNGRWPGIFHGQLDDQYCQEGVNNPNAKMYACGRRPSK